MTLGPNPGDHFACVHGLSDSFQGPIAAGGLPRCGEEHDPKHSGTNLLQQRVWANERAPRLV